LNGVAYAVDFQTTMEDHAVSNQRVAPSDTLQQAIDDLLAEGFADPSRLAELGRLGARLVMQRGVDEEVVTFLGRARYERTPAAKGSRPSPSSTDWIKSIHTDGVLYGTVEWPSGGLGDVAIRGPQLR